MDLLECKNKTFILIPVYHVSEYLAECVDSIQRQTYSHIQTVLVDDGSSDCSGEMCDEYALSNKSIITYHKQNGGLSSARNVGIDVATGEYLYFLDSDDYIADDAIEKLVNNAQQNHADMVFFDGVKFFDECDVDNNPNYYQRQKEYPATNGCEQLIKLLNNDEYRTAVPLCFYKRDYIINHSMRFYEGIIHEDEHFSFLAFVADGVVAHCHENLYFRRMRPGSIMTSGKAQYRFDSMVLIYYDLADRYRNKSFVCEASRMYLIRTAKGVIAKYNLLDSEGQAVCFDEYQSFRKNVMKFRGFGDMKLKIKCSYGLARFWFRLQNKFFTDIMEKK